MDKPTTEVDKSITKLSHEQELYQNYKSWLYELERLKNKDLHDRKLAEYEPLIKQAKEVLEKIHEEVEEYHGEQFKNLTQLMNYSRSRIDVMLVEQARANVFGWYPAGTIVSKWHHVGRAWRYKLEKSSTKGMVCVYDGTQIIAENTACNEKPKIGDTIILELKKDGTISKKCHLIIQGEYGFKSSHTLTTGTYWCIDSESPDNCLMRRILDNHQNKNND